jgi:DNA-binding XRE family transcriptional regulator
MQFHVRMGLIEEVTEARRLPPPIVRRAIRVAAGVSQTRLAGELEVHRITVVRWETGKSEPAGALRLKYARLLDELREITSQQVRAA